MIVHNKKRIDDRGGESHAWREEIERFGTLKERVFLIVAQRENFLSHRTNVDTEELRVHFQEKDLRREIDNVCIESDFRET